MINDNDAIVVPEKLYHYTRDSWNLLYDPVNVCWIRLNKDGMKILEAIKEYRHLDKISTHLAKEFTKQSHQEIRQVAERFIENMTGIGFLHVNEYKKRSLDFFCQEVPSDIYLLMTYRCNLKCRYCYNISDRCEWIDEPDASAGPDMTLAEYRRLVEEARDLGVKRFLFTGGEPLLNPLTIEVAKYVTGQGMDTELLTNGILIDEANAGTIAESFALITISLDSLDKESHEQMRGKGTFAKAVNSINSLKAHGAQVRANSVITSVNVHEILATWIEVQDRLKCDYYTPALYIPIREDAETCGELLPVMADLLKEQDRIRGHFKDKPGIAFKEARIRFSCGIGNGEISVSPDGIVFPCHTLHKPELYCGNLREQRLEQILKESPVLEKLRQFNVNEVEVCAACDFKYLCGGGCLALNYNVYGDFYRKSEFYCDYLKQEQVERLWASTTQKIKNKEVPSC